MGPIANGASILRAALLYGAATLIVLLLVCLPIMTAYPLGGTAVAPRRCGKKHCDCGCKEGETCRCAQPAARTSCACCTSCESCACCKDR